MQDDCSNNLHNIDLYMVLLLQDISPEKDTGPPTVNDQILTWVSYIGGCICIVCLVITIAVNIGVKLVVSRYISYHPAIPL